MKLKILFIITLFLVTKIAIAQNNTVCVYFFYGATCPHCAKEKPFLHQLQEKYPEIELYEFEVYYNETNKNFFEKVASSYNTRASGVPMTFIGDKAFIGFIEGESEIYDPNYKAYIGYSASIEKTIKGYIESGGVSCPTGNFIVNEKPTGFNSLLFFSILTVIALLFIYLLLRKR
jgi:thiol-disulfide isomerase/thioredoxin